MEENKKLKPDGFMYIICFLFPVVGCILYAFYVTVSPREAKDCMATSLTGFLIVLVIVVLLIAKVPFHIFPFYKFF